MPPFSAPMTVSKLGYFKDGSWTLDINGNGVDDGCAIDRCLSFGQPGDIPLAGDWGAPQGLVSVGVYRPSNHAFFLDYNHNGVWDGDCNVDRCYFGFAWPPSSDDLPVVGRWTNTAQSMVGVFRRGDWYLDLDGNGQFQAGTDFLAHYGSTGDRPIVGQWSGPSFTDQLGIDSFASYTLDAFNDHVKGACGATEACGSFGASTDIPVAGKWHDSSPTPGHANSSIGVYRAGAWYLDANSNETWDGCAADDCVTQFGDSTTSPVVGEWPQVQWSTKTDTRWTPPGTATKDAWTWENTSAVVPPGNPACLNGRAFLSVGQTLKDIPLGRNDNPALQIAELNNLGTPLNDILPSRLLSQVTAQDDPGGDNQLLHFSNGDLVQVRVGSYGNNPIYGALYVWVSKDCGNTWQLASTIKADDPNIAGGRARLKPPEVYGAHAAVYRPSDGYIYIDRNGNYTWDPATDGVQGHTDEKHQLTPSMLSNNFGVQPGDVVVVGDWRKNLRIVGSTTSGKSATNIYTTAVGRYRAGQWLLDTNGNFIDDGCGGGPDGDTCYSFGAAGDTPIVGRWTATADGDERSQIGTFNNGVWRFDMNSNGTWDAADNEIHFGGAGDLPVVGAWNSTGPIGGPQRAGVFKPSSHQFLLDVGANGWNGCGVDLCYNSFGSAGQRPLAAAWLGGAGLQDQIGTFADGGWNRDLNANGVFEGCTGGNPAEGCQTFGVPGDVPLPGMWGGGYGGFDRAEAYADSSNGMLYITSTGGGRDTERLLLSSNDEGTNWKAILVDIPAPITITAMGNRLYLYGTRGADPVLITAQVNKASNTVSILSENYVYANSGAFAQSGGVPSAVPPSDRVQQTPAAGCRNATGSGGICGASLASGSVGIAALGRFGSTDILLATYPVASVVAGQNTQAVQVMRINVNTFTNRGLQVGVTTSNQATLVSSFGNGIGTLIQATLIEGPSGSQQAAIYWNDTDATTPDAMPAAQVAVKAKVFSLANDSSVRASSLISLSQAADGTTRSWTGANLYGDYRKGASFMSADGTVNYFAQWTEPDSVTHTQIIAVHP